MAKLLLQLLRDDDLKCSYNQPGTKLVLYLSYLPHTTHLPTSLPSLLHYTTTTVNTTLPSPLHYVHYPPCYITLPPHYPPHLTTHYTIHYTTGLLYPLPTILLYPPNQRLTNVDTCLCSLSKG